MWRFLRDMMSFDVFESTLWWRSFETLNRKPYLDPFPQIASSLWPHYLINKQKNAKPALQKLNVYKPHANTIPWAAQATPNKLHSWDNNHTATSRPSLWLLYKFMLLALKDWVSGLLLTCARTHISSLVTPCQFIKSIWNSEWKSHFLDSICRWWWPERFHTVMKAHCYVKNLWF